MTDRDFLTWLGKWCRIYKERARDDSARQALGDVADLVSNYLQENPLQENPTGRLTPGPTRKVE